MILLYYNARGGEENFNKEMYRVGLGSKIVDFALYNMCG